MDSQSRRREILHVQLAVPTLFRLYGTVELSDDAPGVVITYFIESKIRQAAKLRRAVMHVVKGMEGRVQSVLTTSEFKTFVVTVKLSRPRRPAEVALRLAGQLFRGMLNNPL